MSLCVSHVLLLYTLSVCLSVCQICVLVQFIVDVNHTVAVLNVWLITVMVLSAVTLCILHISVLHVSPRVWRQSLSVRLTAKKTTGLM